MKVIFSVMAGCVLVACVGVSKNELIRAKTVACTREQFAAQPFGFDLTIENFERYCGKTLRKEHYLMDGQPAEAYRFFKGRTDFLFRQAYQMPLELISAEIHTSKVSMANGICVGMTRKAFFWKFSDWLYDSADLLSLSSPETGYFYHFAFAKDKLRYIKITNLKTQMERFRRDRIMLDSLSFHSRRQP
ncbi:MAG: hypothetical protein LBS03_02465 [Bacteroidales bacterium]|jgi:hypothetical protein|nr:hypothetical protein [Bacteroidales bacterium]